MSDPLEFSVEESEERRRKEILDLVQQQQRLLDWNERQLQELTRGSQLGCMERHRNLMRVERLFILVSAYNSSNKKYTYVIIYSFDENEK